MVATFLINFLLRFVPGLGPLAPVIARLTVAFGTQEATAAYQTVKELVREAAANPAFTSGAQRFAWVWPNAIVLVAKEQPTVLQQTIRTFLEMEVAAIKAGG